MRKRPLFFFIVILLVAVAGGFFVYPAGFGRKVLPWRLGLDLVGGSHLVYEVDMRAVADRDRSSVLNGLRDVIERRVNLFGVSEPQVYAAESGGSHRLVVELAGIRDVGAAIKEIGETPFLYFAAEGTSTPALPPGGSGATTTPGLSFVPTTLTGRYVKAAQLILDQITGVPQISLEFTSEGAAFFEQITAANVGKRLGVFLDNVLVTAPIVQEKITGGRAQITGTFTLPEARAIVERFNAGALPAPIAIVSQQTVGASLGADSLRTTLWAGWLGTLIVMLFMVFYYRYFGVFASGALLIYIAFTLAVFKLFSITMTLSGIAGLILSIGMAVDANILIFERTKEEMKRGLSRPAGLEEGFRRAWFSIRDSNVATIITSVILYLFTSGFVRGFALALLIGVLISMFSAITVTRTMLRVFMKEEGRPSTAKR